MRRQPKPINDLEVYQYLLKNRALNITWGEEDLEQIKFILYLSKNNIKFHYFAGSTWTPSYMQVKKNMLMGQSKGFPDLIVYLPELQNNTNRNIIIIVEMKKVKGGTVSKEQKEWIECLNKVVDVECIVARGSKEAIDFISQFIII